MRYLPKPLEQLIQALCAFPGIGRRAAERIALYVVEKDRESGRIVAQKLVEAIESIKFCKICGGFTEFEICNICLDKNRLQNILCVVERPLDIILIERTGVYRGVYHVLGGRLSPIEGVEPEDLRIDELERRLQEQKVEEVILALSTSVEGDATAHYLVQKLKPYGVRITRPGTGLPVGTHLEWADELTISQAFELRRPVE